MFPVAGRFIFSILLIFMILLQAPNTSTFSLCPQRYNSVHVHCLLHFSLLASPYAEARITLMCDHVCVLGWLGDYMR